MINTQVKKIPKLHKNQLKEVFSFLKRVPMLNLLNGLSFMYQKMIKDSFSDLLPIAKISDRS